LCYDPLRFILCFSGLFILIECVSLNDRKVGQGVVPRDASPWRASPRRGSSGLIALRRAVLLGRASCLAGPRRASPYLATVSLALVGASLCFSLVCSL
jgi:hypothetical protein